MDKKLYIRENEEIKKVLKALKMEFFDLKGINKNDEDNHSFLFEFVPVELPQTAKYETINAFKTVLEGACALTDGTNSERTKVSVIELDVDEGTIESHSYIITPIEFSNGFYSFTPTFYSYFFVRSATSSKKNTYQGTGTEIQKEIQLLIDNRIPIVRQKFLRLNSIKSVEGLFYELGPLVRIYFPHFEVYSRDLNVDDRFMD